jgi:predicted anti-sigma-YlaC factor YlaD
MMCEKLRHDLMEAVLSGPETLSLEAQEHLRSCSACAAELASFQETMSLLDEWQAPEPSPYFTSRLMARVREEAASPARSWFAWLRRPMVAVVAAVLMALGVSLLQLDHFYEDHNTLANNDGVVHVNAPGTAVGDLQYLDKNADLFSEFDALDGQSSSE